MSSLLVNSGNAAVIVLANAIVSKMFMTLFFRFKMVMSDKVGKKNLLESAEFKNAHAAQLNDAEYSPIFIVCLLYLHSHGVAAPTASTLAAFGCVAYVWGKIYLPFPSQSVGAAARYVSLCMLCWDIYKTVA